MTNFQLYIGGCAVDGASAMEVINPATERLVALCPRADETQLNEAVAAAKAAFPAWSKTPIAERRAMINKITDGIEARSEEIARTLTQEQGKILADSQGAVMGMIWMMRS